MTPHHDAPAVQALLASIRAQTAETSPRTGRPTLAPAVLAALEAVPRDRFVDPDWQDLAWADTSLPIGHDQTISQPFIVALMTDLLDLQPDDRVLEIGTGSGYQAAVLARLARQVESVEVIEPLAQRAAGQLRTLGCANVHVHVGDGHQGWPPAAPYDAIIVTAATPHVPPALLDQLQPGGRLVLPLGPAERYHGGQWLTRMHKDAQGQLTQQRLLPVTFVPFTTPRPAEPRPRPA